MILVVEDEPTIAVFIGEICADLGVDFRVAESMRRAFDAASARVFRLLIIDLRLPDGKGIDLVKRIRALPPPFGTVPIIIQSGDTQRALTDALMAGADAALEKPYTLDLLKSRIASLMRD